MNAIASIMKVVSTMISNINRLLKDQRLHNPSVDYILFQAFVGEVGAEFSEDIGY